MTEKKLHPLVAGLITIIFLGGAFYGRIRHEKNSIAKINSYEACRDAGFQILESYPPQCKTLDGRIFSENTPKN
jgi:hypothetical protein